MIPLVCFPFIIGAASAIGMLTYGVVLVGWNLLAVAFELIIGEDC